MGLRSKPPWHHGGHGVVDIVGPVAPPGRASGRGDSQECTQIAENGLSAPFWGICVHCCASRGSCEQPWGRRSVHKSVEMAPRSRFGSFVYTVATRVAIRIATRAAPGGTSASTTMACRRRPSRRPLSLGREDGLCASGAAVSGVFAEALIHTNPRRAQKALRGFWWVARAGTERKRGRRAIAPSPGKIAVARCSSLRKPLVALLADHVIVCPSR